MKILDRNVDLGLLALRIGLGSMMLLHGVFKLIHGNGPIESMVVAQGMPAFFAMGVYIGEVVAPLLIIFGYATRAAASVLIVNCLVAALMVHSTQIFTLNDMGGWAVELLGLYALGALTLVFTGGGKYSVSRRKLWD